MADELDGRPTAAELVDAVREFLEGTLLPQIGTDHAFHLRVAVNALGMVGRELRRPPRVAVEHGERLAALGVSDDAELAALIRAGGVPPDELPRVARGVLADVEARLEVSRPGYVARYVP